MNSNYWTQITNQRLSRRRGLTLSAAAAGSAALLAACGSGGGGGKTQDQSGRVAQPRDVTGQVKRGGILADWHLGDERDLSPLTTSRNSGGVAQYAYSRLLDEKVAAGGTKGVSEWVPNLAESFELSNDGLTMTLKLRPDAKLDPRPPTSSRPMNADDVVYTWQRWSAASPFRSELFNAANPAAGILSMTKIDARTVQVKTAFPWRALYPGLGAYFIIMPTESEDKFDPKTDMRGSGPWLLEDYQRSLSFRFRKNPNYWDKSYPFLDGFDKPIITENAAQIAQFRAKHIDAYAPTAEGGNIEDVVQLAKDLPDVNIYETSLLLGGDIGVVFFGKRTPHFHDARVRRAISMGIDREIYAKVMSAADKLEPAGLNRDLYINSHVKPSWGDMWLNPNGKEIGEGSKYFKFDIAEAKKLLAAAGYPNGFEIAARVSSRSHGAGKPSEITNEMINQIGIKTQFEVVDYQGVFLPRYLQNRGDFEGISWTSLGNSGFDVAQQVSRVWTSSPAASRSSWDDDTQRKIDSIIERAAKEVDSEKYRSLMHEFQREEAMYQGGISHGFSAADYTLVWPWVQNWRVWRASDQITDEPFSRDRLWIDDSKKTKA